MVACIDWFSKVKKAYVLLINQAYTWFLSFLFSLAYFRLDNILVLIFATTLSCLP